MRLIGIDPGKQGGITVIDYANSEHEEITIHALSKLTLPEKNEVFSECSKSTTNQEIFCLIEKVHAFPKQGVSSTFNFGQAYGELLGMLVANGIPFSRISPQKWMKYFTVSKSAQDKTKHKKQIKQLAQELYPEKTKDIILEVADSVLIATYLKSTSNRIRMDYNAS